MASATEELDLLERVFLRIGAAETDEQLEATVSKFLIPVLNKLSSGNEGVRKKVMELLVHVNTRLKRRPTVQLPVEALLKQYADPSASSFLINFSILYIKVGFPRLPAGKQQELAPLLVSSMVGKPQQHQNSLLLLLVSIFETLKVPSDVEKRKTFLGLDQHPDLVPLLSSFLLDILLMPYVWIPVRTEGQPPAPAPPGMSPYGMARISSPEVPMTGETLEKTKKGVMQLITSGIFPVEEAMVHLLVAVADTRFGVTDLAETELNRIVRSVDWSNVAMASKLFSIYLGSSKAKNIPEANRRQPANTRIRMKLLPYLSRLEKNAILFPFCLQIVFDSLYGVNSNPKLMQLAVNYALSIVQKSDRTLLNKISPMLYTGMLKLVWDREMPDKLKVVAYTTIGQIVKRTPSIINTNLIELQVFFDNLSSAQPDLRSAVRDALLCMVNAFKLAMQSDAQTAEDGPKPMEVQSVESMTDAEKIDGKKGDSKADDPATRDMLMTLLLAAQVEERESLSRFVAVTYAGTVFPPDHVVSRYLLLLSTGDSVSSVATLGLKSLYAGPPGIEDEKEVMLQLPDFPAMTRCVFEKATARLKNPNQRAVVANSVLPFNLTVVGEVLHYLRTCLASSAGVKVTKKTLLAHPCDASPLIGKYIKGLQESDPDAVQQYLSLINMFMNPSSLLAPLQSLEEVIGCCSDVFSAKYTTKLPQFLSLLCNPREEVRESSALVYSCVSVATLSESQLRSSLATLLKDLAEKSSNQEQQHGYLLAVSTIFEQLRMRGTSLDTWAEFKEAAVAIAKHLETGESLVQSAACLALSQVGRTAALPLPDASEGDEKVLSKKSLLTTLNITIKSNKTNSKVKERAIASCGFLCLGEEFPFAELIVQNFLDLSREIKDIDLHFSIGEALIFCIEGTSSVSCRDAWRVGPDEYIKPALSEKNQKLLKWLIAELIKLSAQPHPNIRQAVCAYLLSLTKRLAHVQVLLNARVDIQGVFMEFLSENNELVQDMASKGLALVYENSSPEQQKTLVAGLLDQLLAGKRSVQQVTADTKLFEEGQLGNAPTGGNLTTYKELCSLASDLNQPDLIYKFMHLANHNAVWNSKKGAAFGFQTIASQANEQLTEFLPKVVPRLYRYQFDPTPRIQQSMSNIWKSLVKDPSKTIEKYQNEILNDLLDNLTSSQWRVRLSCCAALSDFFRGDRSILNFKDKLNPLWTSLFRVMDDFHEGTRLSAQTTAKYIANICVRVCDVERVKPDEEFINILLEVFLKGINNSVSEVRSLSLHTVSQLVSSAGTALKPSLTLLIPALLEAAGELESVGLSHLSAQFGGHAQAQDMIDSARASATKSHYTTQTVTKCVQYLELPMMDTMVPKMMEIMRSVNLGSRIASAHLIVLLAHHFGKTMDPYTGKFLAGLVNGLLDRNAAVRKTYASTIGQIIHTAKTSSIERLMNKLNSWYFEKEDGNTRAALGATLQAAAQYNSELLKEQFPIVIPLVFFAMHDQKTEETKSQVEMWEEVWNEITPGTEAGIQQHLSEITALMEKALSSPSWNMKAQAGRCLSTAAVRLDHGLVDDYRSKLLLNLLKALDGRTFRGKEELVSALSNLIKHAAPAFREASPDCVAVVDALLKEAGKTDVAYKRHSLQAVGVVLEACPSIDRFKEVYSIVQEMLKKAESSEEKAEGDVDELTKARNEKYKTLSVLYETLGKAWPVDKETQLEFQEPVLKACLQTLELSPRDVQVSILCALHNYLEKLHYWKSSADLANEIPLSAVMDKVAQALVFSLGVAKHTRLRKEALNIVGLLTKKLAESKRSSDLAKLIADLRPSILELEQDHAPEIRTRLMDLKDLFK